MLGRRTALLTLPICDDRVYCYCDVVPGDPDSAEHDPAERLRHLFSEFAEPAATLLDALDAAADIHVSTIEEVALDSSAREHVVLIGDAAHATSPNMAQGAAISLEDALVLTDCLQRIPAIPDAITAFQARRRPRTDWVRAQTHRRDHTRYLPPTIRDNVLRFLGRRIFHANYRRSSTNPEPPGPPPLLRPRRPDAIRACSSTDASASTAGRARLLRTSRSRVGGR